MLCIIWFHLYEILQKTKLQWWKQISDLWGLAVTGRDCPWKNCWSWVTEMFHTMTVQVAVDDCICGFQQSKLSEFYLNCLIKNYTLLKLIQLSLKKEFCGFIVSEALKHLNKSVFEQWGSCFLLHFFGLLELVSRLKKKKKTIFALLKSFQRHVLVQHKFLLSDATYFFNSSKNKEGNLITGLRNGI